MAKWISRASVQQYSNSAKVSSGKRYSTKSSWTAATTNRPATTSAPPLLVSTKISWNPRQTGEAPAAMVTTTTTTTNNLAPPVVRTCNFVCRYSAPPMPKDVYTMALQCSVSGAASPTLDFAWNTRARHTRLREEVMERALPSCRRHSCDGGYIRRALLFVVLAVSQASIDFFEPASIGEYTLM